MIRKEWLLLNKEYIPDMRDHCNQTLLFQARNVEEVNWLIDNGVDISHQDFMGRIALWGNGKIDYIRREHEIINRLFELGSNADLLDNHGNNILSSSVFFSHPELFIRHQDKYKCRDVIINSIYGGIIYKMADAIELLRLNGFKVYFPQLITLDIDITKLDKDNTKHLIESQKKEIRNFYMQRHDYYIKFFHYLNEVSSHTKIIHHHLNDNKAIVYEIEEYLYRLNNMLYKKPNPLIKYFS